MLALVREHAEYEGAAGAVEATPDLVHEAFFSDEPRVHALVAADRCSQAIIGLAVWFRSYSTWTGRPGIFLEDLIVAASARDSGVGRALLTGLAAHAVGLGYPRMDWTVGARNESAQRFYRSAGAVPLEGWVPWRLDGAALTTLGRAGDLCPSGEGGRRRVEQGKHLSEPGDLENLHDVRAGTGNGEPPASLQG